MVAGVTLDLLAILAGTLGMLWLLVGLFGRRAPVRPYGEPFHPGSERESASEDEAPFIFMPRDITSHADMVAWMTKELPILVEEASRKPQDR